MLPTTHMESIWYGLKSLYLVYYTIVCLYTCITHTCKDNLIDEINDSIFCTLILVQQFVYLWLDRPIYVSQFFVVVVILQFMAYTNVWPTWYYTLFMSTTISWNLYIANWTSNNTEHRIRLATVIQTDRYISWRMGWFIILNMYCN